MDMLSDHIHARADDGILSVQSQSTAFKDEVSHSLSSGKDKDCARSNAMAEHYLMQATWLSSQWPCLYSGPVYTL